MVECPSRTFLWVSCLGKYNTILPPPEKRNAHFLVQFGAWSVPLCPFGLQNEQKLMAVQPMRQQDGFLHVFLSRFSGQRTD